LSLSSLKRSRGVKPLCIHACLFQFYVLSLCDNKLETVAHVFFMRQLIEQKLLPFVIKPGRYAGGEPGQIVKDPAGRVNYLHSYPDMYEIGQSYVGLHE